MQHKWDGNNMAPYKTEKELFDKTLRTPFLKKFHEGDNSFKIIEPKGLFGIPNLLVVKRGNSNTKRLTTTSFEMKLRNWKRALVQAFKYKAFSNYSYVVIDHYYISAPLKHIDRFKQSNIGLVSVDRSGKVHIHVRPSKDNPYCNATKEKVVELANSRLSCC